MKKITIRRIKKLLQTIEESKSAYKELDSIVQTFISRGYRVSDKTTRAILVDNFQKNTAFRAVSFRRFELKLERIK